MNTEEKPDLAWFWREVLRQGDMPDGFVDVISDLQQELELKNGDSIVTKMTAKGRLTVHRNKQKIASLKPKTQQQAKEAILRAHQEIAVSIAAAAGANR